MGYWERRRERKEQKKLESIDQSNILTTSKSTGINKDAELSKEQRLAIQRKKFASAKTQVKEIIPSLFLSAMILLADYLIFGGWLFILSVVPITIAQYVYTQKLWRPPSVLLKWFGMDEQGVIHDHTYLVPKEMWALVSKENIEGTMHIREGTAYHVENIEFDNSVEGGLINKVKYAWHHHSQFDFFNRFAEYDTMRTLYYVALKENSQLKNMSHIISIRDAIKTTDDRMDAINSAYKFSDLQVQSKVGDITENVELMEKERQLIESKQQINGGLE